jgi:FdhD protein
MDAPLALDLTTVVPRIRVGTAPIARRQSRSLHEAGTDAIAREEPLEIRVQGVALAVLMRTPGQDEELATGFVLSELMVAHGDIEAVRHCSIGEHADHVMLVTLRDGCEFESTRFVRSSFVSSSCGACSKRTREAAMRLAEPLANHAAFPAQAALRGLEMLPSQQRGFAACGGLHAVGLADIAGRLLCVREDIGRHNALDKVIGWMALSPRGNAKKADVQTHEPAEQALLLSGRCSFEMVQKALAARLSTIVAIGGVSSLAVEVAQAAGMNLAGFARNGEMSVYAGEFS